MDPNKVK